MKKKKRKEKKKSSSAVEFRSKKAVETMKPNLSNDKVGEKREYNKEPNWFAHDKTIMWRKLSG